MHRNAAERGNYSRAARAVGTTMGRGGSLGPGGHGLPLLFRLPLCPFVFPRNFSIFTVVLPLKRGYI